MRNLITGIVSCIVLVSCGGADPVKDAQDICDCYTKANGLKADDPNRSAEQDKCMKMQTDKWTSYKDDPENLLEFNKAIGECSKKTLEKSLEGY